MGRINDYLIKVNVERASEREPMKREKPKRAHLSMPGATRIVAPLLEKTVFEGMYKEAVQNNRYYDKYLNELDKLAEASLQSPRRFEVHQMWDPVIIDDWWW